MIQAFLGISFGSFCYLIGLEKSKRYNTGWNEKLFLSLLFLILINCTLHGSLINQIKPFTNVAMSTISCFIIVDFLTDTTKEHNLKIVRNILGISSYIGLIVALLLIIFNVK